MSSDYSFAALTDVGRLRANNEDAVRVDPAHGVAVLADGMGGYNAGEVASAMAVDIIAADLARWLAQAEGGARDVRRAMEICVDQANRAIYEAAHANDAYTGMGTTLVMAVLRDGVAVIGHVGDSRAYRWREGRLVQLTRDHSLLQEQLDIGLITAAEAAVSSNRNLVTRALGVEDTVLLELTDAPVAPGDVLLLCSDGLNDMLGDDDIAALLDSDEPLADRCQRLVDGANARGGRDNVSVVLIGVPGLPEQPA